MENLQAVAVIIGIINGARLAKEQNKWGLVWFVSAVVVGIVLGSLGWFGLTPQTGLIAALTSSGVYRGLEKVGGGA